MTSRPFFASALLLAGALFLGGSLAAQEPIDATLPDGVPTNTSIAQPFGGSARAGTASDDFNRAAGTNLGADWSEWNGDSGILNNELYGVLSSFNQNTIFHTSASCPYDQSTQSMDFLGAQPGTSLLVYNALIFGWDGFSENVFIKVQDNNSDGFYDRVFFYRGVNGGSWGQSPYFFDLATPGVTDGRMTAYFTNAGDTAVLELDYDYDGIPEETFSSDLVNTFSFLLGNSHGIGHFNAGTSDNWDLNGGGPGVPTLSVTNLVAGMTATASVTNATPGGLVYVGYSLAGPGPTMVPAGPCGSVTVDLSAPFVLLPPATADPGGAITISAPVPPGTTGVSVWAHAFDFASCTLTNSLALTIG